MNLYEMLLDIPLSSPHSLSISVYSRVCVCVHARVVNMTHTGKRYAMKAQLLHG